MFEKTNQRVEKMSDFVFMVVAKIAVQCAILPKCIGSFGDYFMSDLGRDAFQLPFPMW